MQIILVVGADVAALYFVKHHENVNVFFVQYIPYMYKFSRDVIFTVFVDNV